MAAYLQLLLASAFAAGLLGGAHCAAMCGGIASAVCARGDRGMPWRRALAYNGGRIASYAIAGATVGGIGEAALALRGGAAAQHAVMFFAGAALVVLALYLLGWRPLVRAVEGVGGGLWRRLQPLARHVLPADTLPRALGLGLLWGWLPCGMVYAVLLTAAATGSSWQAAAVMASFGLGTLPSLIALAAFAQRMRAHRRLRSLRVAGAVLIAGFGLYGIAHAVQPHALHALVACVTGGAPASVHAH